MFLHDTLQPFYPVWDCSVCSSKGVELCMDGFSPLLPKEPESNMSESDPLSSVVLQHVHFYGDCCTRKCSTEVAQEFLDALSC